jgi:hypothetical protein
MFRNFTGFPWSCSRMAPVEGLSGMLPPVTPGMEKFRCTMRLFQITVTRVGDRWLLAFAEQCGARR